MTAWTAGPEEVDDQFDPTRTARTSVIRSDDGAMLIARGANRDRAQFFDYRRDNLRLRFAGTQYNQSDTEASDQFVICLSDDIDSMRIRYPDWSPPNVSALERLKQDIAEAMPAWDLVTGSGVPIREVVFT